MEQTEEKVILLNQLSAPAFFVSDGRVTHVNTGAKSCLIAPGTSVSGLLATGQTEYSEFRQGCLYLSLDLHGSNVSASVTRVGEADLFVLEQKDDIAELQAMALAAQQLRAPLSNVMTVVDHMFPLACLDDDPSVQTHIARINRGLFQMLRIISNMSDVYRYSHASGCHLEVRDVRGLIEEILEKNGELMGKADTVLHYTLPPEAVFSLVDSEKVERAVNNILSNALKFCRKGSVIDARLTRRGNMLYLTVQNENAAISEDTQVNVYNRFRREPGLEDNRFGIGLGMVLIRSAAAAHGGTVLMEQNAGGTRITMTMAIRQASGSQVCSPIFRMDYAGERDHSLIELSESLPLALYSRENIN